MKLLLAEDELRMAQALKEILKQENYDVDHFADGISACEAAVSDLYDIIVLDVMLPGMSGYDIAAAVRRKNLWTPILMLTAKGELDDKVRGLDSGADDYLTKPFMTKELLARLRALSRRKNRSNDKNLTYGDISLDTSTLTLTCLSTEQSVRLSEKEYRILEYLIVNKGQILTREQFAVRIWGIENDTEYNNVEVYMTFTRKKLNFVGSKNEIKAVRGIGYELRFADV